MVGWLLNGRWCSDHCFSGGGRAPAVVVTAVVTDTSVNVDADDTNDGAEDATKSSPDLRRATTEVAAAVAISFDCSNLSAASSVAVAVAQAEAVGDAVVAAGAPLLNAATVVVLLPAWLL